MSGGVGVFASLVLAASVASCGGCGKGSRATDDAGSGGEAGFVSAPSATAAGAPRAGMVWVPAGIVRAGTPLGRVPRIAEEELPGTEIALGGFYVDVLPYPNEAGAIPTSNVSRDDAARMCEAKKKRLCTELEWERACKGPEGTTYEYGDAYHAATCDTGIAGELAAKRPSGERLACKSGFGAMDMHGGAWEWTDGPWGRGHTGDLGVLRGGNAVAGEIVGRCANAIGRAPSSKAPTMGFRCCAGPKNDAKVELLLDAGPVLERSTKTAELAAPLLPFATEAWGADAGGAFAFVHAFTWRPVANEALVIASGCSHAAPRARCGLIVARLADASDGAPASPPVSLAQIDTGSGEATEVAQIDARHLRLKGWDAAGPYLRDFSYAYGRIELGDPKR